jgi:tetratricopeptide (TPR) repeat protein
MYSRKPDARFFKDQGIEFLRQRKFRLARRAFDAALVLNPDDHYSLRKLAECYTKLGEHESALRCWERLGENLMRKGYHRKAIAAYTMVLHLSPGDTRTQALIELIREDLAFKVVRQKEMIGSGSFKKPEVS